MAEKLLTGASFKAPDWKGPTVATAAIAEVPPASAAAAVATAKHALDTEMLDVEADAADMAPGAAPDASTPRVAATRDRTVAAVPTADAPVPMLSGAPLLLGPVMQRDCQQQPAEVAQLPQQPVAPPAARRPTFVIRQPGWRPPPQLQQCPQQPLPPQPLHIAPSPPPQPEPVTHVNDLPDDLLQRIFSMLPFRKRCRSALVLPVGIAAWR